MTPADFVRTVPVPVLYIQNDDRIGAMNPRAAEMFGEQALGRYYVTVLRQPSLLEQIEQAQNGDTPTTGKFFRSDAGRDLVYAVTSTPLGRKSGVMVAFEDVTIVKEAGQMRSDFVANVSHELRTPLTALTGFIETLRGPAKDDAEARARFLDIMEREAGRMNRLVQDLLSLSRVEDVERARPTDHVDLAAIVTAVATGDAMGLGPMAEAASVRLITKGCTDPVFIQGDSDQMTQVFTNLVENAIKYGAAPGTVTLTLTVHDKLPLLRGSGVTVEVADEGEGISQRHLARLTERFYRVDGHRARGVGGTGLGLAIVKHIINRHRGRLRITSQVGQGSQFTVFLPLADKKVE